MENNEPNSKFLPGAVIVAGLLVAGALLWNNAHPVAGTADTKGGPIVNIKNVKTAGNPFIGAPNAPVTIAFWSDFQCPYCKSFEIGGVAGITTPAAFPDIIKNYVDTGKVKVVFMDFAFLGPDSTDAALYNQAIWKLYPNKYFEWRTAMYEAQDEEHGGFGNVASIDKLNATIVGIDAAKVAADVKANTPAYQAMIDADKAEGQKVGINATPSFVIGKQMIMGAYPYARFQEAIDAALK